MFGALGKRIQGDRIVQAFQAPGFDAQQQTLDNTEELAAYYLDLIERTYPEGDVILGGWSMGGVVAHTLGHLIAAKGRKVKGLLLFDSFLPKNVPDDSSQKRDDPAADLSAYLDDIRRVNIPASLGLEGIIAEAQAGGHLDTRVEWADLRDAVAVYTAGRRAFRAWQPGPQIACPAIYVKAAGYTEVRDAAIKAWKPLIGGTLTVIDSPGDHYTMFEPQALNATVSLLRSTLKNWEV